jgi:DNA-binding protein H-NS
MSEHDNPVDGAPAASTQKLNFGAASPDYQGDVKSNIDAPPTETINEHAPENLPDSPVEQIKEEVAEVTGAPVPSDVAPDVFAETVPEVVATDDGEGQATAPSPIPEQAAAAQEAVAESPVASTEVPAIDTNPTVAINADVNGDNGLSDVDELTKQREAIDAKIAAQQTAQRASVIAQIKQVVDTYKIPVKELVDALGGYKATRQGSKAKAKYRDPSTGKEWSGRGKEPLWIKGKNRDSFLIVG